MCYKATATVAGMHATDCAAIGGVPARVSSSVNVDAIAAACSAMIAARERSSQTTSCRTAIEWAATPMPQRAPELTSFPAPLCVSLSPTKTDASSTVWGLAPCSEATFAVCAKWGTIGLTSTVVSASCNSPGCTASATASDFATGNSSIAAAEMTILVQQIDLEGSDQRVVEVLLNGSRISECEGGRGGATCGLRDWRACGPPVRVQLSSDEPIRLEIASSASVTDSCPGTEPAGAVLNTDVHLRAAVISQPQAVDAHVLRAQGNEVSVGWEWPEIDGGAPIDFFDIAVGNYRETVSANGPRFDVVRALHHSETVVVSGTSGMKALTAKCPMNKVVVWGFSLDFSGTTSAQHEECVRANNHACTPQQETCAQTPCGNVNGFRMIYVLCQTVLGVPVWATASHQKLSSVAVSTGRNVTVSCGASSQILFGFALVHRGTVDVEGDETLQCPRRRSRACTSGATSCAVAGCESAPAVVYAVCAPSIVVAKMRPVARSAVVGFQGGGVDCGVGYETALGMSLPQGITVQVDDSWHDLLASTATTACSARLQHCAVGKHGAWNRLVVAMCVESATLRPTLGAAVVVGLDSDHDLPFNVSVRATNLVGYSSERASKTLSVGNLRSSRPGPPGAVMLKGAPTGGSFVVQIPAPINVGLPRMHTLEVAVSAGACVSETLMTSSSQDLSRALLEPTLLVTPTDAAQARLGRWVGQHRRTSSDQVTHPPVLVRGRVGRFRPILPVVMPTEGITTLRPPVPVAKVGAIRLRFLACVPGLAVEEVEVVDASGSNVAFRAHVAASSHAGFASWPATVADGSCWNACNDSAPLPTWTPGCPTHSVNETPESQQWLQLRFMSAIEVHSVTVRWESLAAIDAVVDSGGVLLEVQDSVSPTLAYHDAGEAGGAIEVGTWRLHDLAISSTVEMVAPRLATRHITPLAALEAWIRIEAQTGSASLVLASDGTQQLAIVLAVSGSLAAVDFQTNPLALVQPRAASVPTRMVVGRWTHVLVSRSGDLAGIVIDGEDHAPWDIFNASDRGGEVSQVVVSSFQHSNATMQPGWRMSESGDTVSLMNGRHVSVAVGLQQWEHRLMMTVDEVPPLCILSECFGSSLLSQKLWYDLDFSVVVSTPLGSLGIATIMFRATGPRELFAFSLDYSTNSALLWSKHGGINEVLGVGSLPLQELAGAARVRIIATGGSISVKVNGLIAVSIEEHSVASLRPTCVFASLINMTGSLSELVAVDLSANLRLGIATGDSGYSARIAIVKSFQLGVSGGLARALHESAGRYFASGGSKEDSWVPASPGVGNLYGWQASPGVGQGSCAVARDGSTSIIHSLVGGGGAGFGGQSGSLTDRKWVQRAFHSPGELHTDVHIRLHVAFVGWWRQQDAVSVEVDGVLAWRGTHVTPATCPDNWAHYQGFCYHAANQTSSYHQAVSLCNNLGNSTVASVGSATEAEFVLSTAASANPVWTCLTDASIEGKYEWGDGSKFLFRPWSPEVAVGASSGDRDCTVLTAGEKLAPVACSSTYDVVCKRPVDGSQCSTASSGVFSRHVDIVSPHSADTVAVKLVVSTAGSQFASAVVLNASVLFKSLAQPLLHEHPHPAATVSFSASNNETVIAGLTPESQFCVAARAVNDVGPGLFSSATTVTTGRPTVPSVVRNLRTVRKTGGSVTVLWSPPLDTGGMLDTTYEVLHSLAGEGAAVSFIPPAAMHFSRNCSGTNPLDVCVRLGGLSAKTSYQLQVSASNLVGTGPKSVLNVMTAEVGPPERPQDFRVLETTGGSVTFAWAAPFSNGGAAVTQYVLNYSHSGGSATTVVQVQDGSQTTLYRLSGLLHSSAVWASVSSHGSPSCRPASAWTDRLQAQTTSGSAPMPPSAPVVDSATGGLLALTWTPDGDTGGHPITSYSLFRFASIDADPVFIARVSSDEFSRHNGAVVSGLAHSTQFLVAVLATNAYGGDSNMSAASAVSTTEATPPTAPRNVSASATGGGSISVVWTPPLDLGGTVSVVFTVTVTFEGDSWVGCHSQQHQCTVVGLTANTIHEFQVIARNEAGEGPGSIATVASTEPPTIPAAPPAPVLQPSTERCSPSGSLEPACNPTGGSVALIMATPTDTGGAPISQHHLELQQADSTWQMVYTGNQGVATVSSLSPSIAYRVRQRVSNSAGTSAPSAVAVVHTSTPSKPGSVWQVQLVAATGGMVCIEWDPPVDNGGSSLTHYTVFRALSSVSREACISGIDTRCILDGDVQATQEDRGKYCVYRLVHSQVYYLYVLAANSVSSGEISDAVVVSTTDQSDPVGVGSLVVVNVEPTSAVVAWTPPSDDGGGGVARYEVVVWPAPTGSVLGNIVAATGELHTTISGLVHSTEYNVTVRGVANTSIGTERVGSWSSPLTFTTARPGSKGYASFAVANVHVSESDSSPQVLPLVRRGGRSGTLAAQVYVRTAAYETFAGSSSPIGDTEFTLIDYTTIPRQGPEATAFVLFTDQVMDSSIQVVIANDSIYQLNKQIELCIQHGSEPTGPVLDCTMINVDDDGDAGWIGLRGESQSTQVREDAGSAVVELFRSPLYVFYRSWCGCD